MQFSPRKFTANSLITQMVSPKAQKRKKSPRRSKSQWIFGTKMPDDKARELIVHYATFRPGQLIAQQMKLSRPTVYGVYHAIRERMLDIGYYHSPDWWIENVFVDPVDQANLRGFVAVGLKFRRNVRSGERHLHEAEFASIFAYSHFYKDAPSMNDLTGLFADDLLELIRITGPLRRPAVNKDKAQRYIKMTVGRRMPREEYQLRSIEEIRRLKKLD
jgi:hypothetical protein